MPETKEELKKKIFLITGEISAYTRIIQNLTFELRKIQKTKDKLNLLIN